jgi:carboxyl-terminal processing protease
MPDIFVPVDTSYFSDYFSRATNLGLIHRFAFLYTDLHRETLENFTTPKEISGYLDANPLKEEFIQFAEEKELKYNAKDFSVSESVILTQIKAYIARNIIDNVGFYSIIKDQDETLKIAIDTLKNS